MRLLRVFLAHELMTQLRSTRFHGVALAYIVVASAPPVGAFFLFDRAPFPLGPGMFAAIVDAFQPLATTIFAALIAVDVISRERDEGSLAVVSLAPVSATGYILRRWVALLLILAPVTLVPRVIAAALALRGEGAAAEVPPIFYGWLIAILPLLAVVSAMSMALGTITSRTVLALIAGLALFTVGLGITNDLLAYAHRQLDGPGEFFGLNERAVQELFWAVRGYVDPGIPSDAGYPFRHELEKTAARAALAAGVAALLLGISCAYLRRTRPDLRPWRIREDHQLRSFLRTMNRFREEYTPDAGLELPERVMIFLGLAIAIGSVAAIFQRADRYEALAAWRYAAEQAKSEPMPMTILPVAASIDGDVRRDGEVRTTVTLTLRNDGESAQRQLTFMLSPMLAIERVSANRGRARASRVWERLTIDVEPPLARGENRTLTFELRGAPSDMLFALPGARSFAASWRRYQQGTTSLDLADLSRSVERRLVDGTRLYLAASSLAPVPRYTKWEVPGPRRSRRLSAEVTFVPEVVTPSTPLAVRLSLPEPFTAVDSCGTRAMRTLSSRCSVALADYVVAGARLQATTLATGNRLLHLPAHAEQARAHGPSLAEAVELARKAWPSLQLDERTLFVERPTFEGDSYYGEWDRVMAMRSITSTGALHLIPELMFIRRKPIDRSIVASSLIASSLTRRRRVVPDEQGFFDMLYETVAGTRTGGRKVEAVERGGGPPPVTDPILDPYFNVRERLARVLADVEYRVGADRLVAGIEDFVAAGPHPGTARELLDAIGRRSGISLERVYSDYFVGRALPKLTLHDVEFVRAGSEWRVRGAVVNEGHGESFCPIVLRTAVGSARTVVRLDSKSRVPFELVTPHEPRTLQLDPDRVVYRFAAVGTVDAIDYRGER